MDGIKAHLETLELGSHGQAPSYCPLALCATGVKVGPRPASSSMLPTVPRVLLVELDGASYDLLVPLAEAGVMPRLRDWIRNASLVSLRPVTPCAEAVLWTTLETGAGPEVHGVLDNSYLDHHSRRLFAWSRRPDSCVGLSDAVTAADPRAPAICLADAVCARTIWRRKPSSFKELAQGIAWLQTQLANLVERVARADATGDWRLLSLRFDLLDALGHRVWNLLGVDSAGGPRAWVDKTREAFVAIDRAFGDLLRLAERRQAAVMLVSPYSQGPLVEKISLSEILRRRDLVRAGSRALQAFHRVGRWTDKLWRWPRGEAGRALRGGFPQMTPVPTVLNVRKIAPYDWRHSRAMTFHGEMAAFVYLNTPERFGQRVLLTRRQRDQAATEVLWALQEATHPVTGQPLFAEAFLTAERYGEDPLTRLWPDIVAIPADGFQIRPGLDRNGRLLRTDPMLTATHRPGGAWMASFPGAEPGRLYTADLVDVAPTVLRLLGLRRTRTMTGRVVEELLRPAAAGCRADCNEPL